MKSLKNLIGWILGYGNCSSCKNTFWWTKIKSYNNKTYCYQCYCDIIEVLEIDTDQLDMFYHPITDIFKSKSMKDMFP